jgi:O-antigen ligase
VTQRRWGRHGQLLGFALLGLYTSAVYATYTRSVWLALICAGVCIAVMTFPVRLKRAVVFASIFTVFAGVFAKDALLSVKRETSAEESKESTEMRAVFAYVSWKMFQDKPFSGFGFGQFAEQKMPYLNDRGTSLDLQSIRSLIHHNSLLNMLVELGLFGFLTYMALFGAWCRRAYRLWADQHAPNWMRGQALLFLLLVIVFVCQMAFHEISYTPLENGLLYMMAGIMSGLYSMRQEKSQPAGSVSATGYAWRTPHLST